MRVDRRIWGNPLAPRHAVAARRQPGLLHEFANKASSWTGGSDGLSGIAPDPVFGLFEFDLYGHTAFFFGMALLLIVFVLLRFLVRSPFGMSDASIVAPAQMRRPDGASR